MLPYFYLYITQVVKNETHKLQLRICTVLLYIFYSHSVPECQCNTASTEQFFRTFQFRIFSVPCLEMYPTLIPCDRTGKKVFALTFI